MSETEPFLRNICMRLLEGCYMLNGTCHQLSFRGIYAVIDMAEPALLSA